MPLISGAFSFPKEKPVPNYDVAQHLSVVSPCGVIFLGIHAIVRNRLSVGVASYEGGSALYSNVQLV